MLKDTLVKKDKFLVEANPNVLKTKRKQARQSDSICSECHQFCQPVSSDDNNVSFSQHVWGIRLENIPLFTKAKTNRFIANTFWLLTEIRSFYSSGKNEKELADVCMQATVEQEIMIILKKTLKVALFPIVS